MQVVLEGLIVMTRKAMPIDLHLVSGNRSRKTKLEIEQRKKAEEAIRPQADKIGPPKWLGRDAKKEFKRLVSELQQVKLVTNVDVYAIARWADAYIDYNKCTAIIASEGLMVEYTNKAAETNRVPHPLLAKKKQLHEQMAKIESDFGMAPASRAKIAMPKKEEKEPTAFEKMFGEV